MDDSLDRTAKEAVSALAAALQDGISDAARTSVHEALEETIGETKSVLTLLDARAKALGNDLEPVVRDSVKGEIGSLKSELSQKLDTAVDRSKAETAELIKSHIDCAIRESVTAAGIHSANAVSKLDEVKTETNNILGKTTELRTQLETAIAESLRQVLGSIKQESGEAVQAVRGDMETAIQQLSALKDDISVIKAGLDSEHARVVKVEAGARRLTLSIMFLSLVAAVCVAAILTR